MPIEGSNLQIPSIYGPLIQNPTGPAQSIQELQRKALENRQLGQQVRGRETIGRIIGQFTTPDGQTDWDKVSAEAAKDPAAAYLLPEIQKAALERKQAGLNLDKTQLELSAARWKLAGDTTGALLASKEPLTRDVIVKNLRDNLVSSGLFNNRESQQQLAGIVEQLSDDDAANRKVLKNVFLQSGMNQERIGMALGQWGDTDLGGQVVGKRTSPLTSETELGAVLPKSLSPAQLAGVVTYIDPETRKEVKTTLGALLGKPVAPGSPLESPGGIASSLAPGEREAATASATASAGVWQKDLAEAGGYAQRIQGLDKASAALEKSLTGPGGAKVQNFAAVLNTFGIKVPTDVDSYAEAQKYLQDYANRRGAELGMGTDSARALVNAANPGVQTPKGAALAVVSVIKGLERMQASQVAAAQAEKVPPERYNEWRANWNRSVDPAAFAPPRLTKEGWEAKKRQMGDKWAAYAKGLQAALQADVLKPSDLRR